MTFQSTEEVIFLTAITQFADKYNMEIEWLGGNVLNFVDFDFDEENNPEMTKEFMSIVQRFNCVE